MPDNSFELGRQIVGRTSITVCTPANLIGEPLERGLPSARVPLVTQFRRGPTISAVPSDRRAPARAGSRTHEVQDGGEVLAMSERDWNAIFSPVKMLVGATPDLTEVVKGLRTHGFTGDADGVRVAVREVLGERTVILRTRRGGVRGLVDRVGALGRWLKESADDTRRAAQIVLQKTGGAAATARTAVRGNGIAILVVGSLTVIEAALSDEEISGRTLALTLVVDALKMAAGAAIGTAAGVIFGAILTAGTAAAAPVVIVAAVGLIVGFVAGLLIESWGPATESIVAAIEAKWDAAFAAFDEALEPARRAWWDSNRFLNWLNTPEGVYWLYRQFGGATRPFGNY